ncbi:MAG: hypothetical protein N3E51_05365, partial [Candidatus Micrarchaeota archaeon]|nr:hypothetical protein [Candidatus Micrarchaeota archaeon]
TIEALNIIYADFVKIKLNHPLFSILRNLNINLPKATRRNINTMQATTAPLGGRSATRASAIPKKRDRKEKMAESIRLCRKEVDTIREVMAGMD